MRYERLFFCLSEYISVQKRIYELFAHIDFHIPVTCIAVFPGTSINIIDLIRGINVEKEKEVADRKYQDANNVFDVAERLIVRTNKTHSKP